MPTVPPHALTCAHTHTQSCSLLVHMLGNGDNSAGKKKIERRERETKRKEKEEGGRKRGKYSKEPLQYTVQHSGLF